MLFVPDESRSQHKLLHVLQTSLHNRVICIRWQSRVCSRFGSGVHSQIVKSPTADQAYLTSHQKDQSQSRPALECTAAFLLTLGLMLWIQFAGPAIVGNDAYYHMRWSRILRASAPHLPAFTWLPLTVLRSSSFADQHFLFHALLMPFTIGDLRLGAKLAASLFSALALTSIFGLLVVYRVQHRWLWLLPLVAGS